MDAQQLHKLVDRLAQLPTSELQSFFLVHGLGAAFAAPGKGWGRRKRIVAALLAAEQRGTEDAVYEDARARFGGFTERGETPKPIARLRRELQTLGADMDAWDGWIYTDRAEEWRDRFNSVLDHLRVHLGSDMVPEDIVSGNRDYSSTGKTITPYAVGVLRRAVSATDELVGSAAPVSVSRSADSRLLALHSDIRRVAEQLYLDGHASQAIFEAYKAVNNRVKSQSGITSDGKSLMAAAFSEQNPVLRLNNASTQSERDEQEGFKLIFMGVMQGIRNPKAHDEVAEAEEDRALEYLAMASLLMRRLDDCREHPDS